MANERLKAKNELRRMMEQGQLIQLPDAAKEQLRQEQHEKIQKHLDEHAKSQTLRNVMLNEVVKAAIEHHGIPMPEQEDAFVDRVCSIARKLSDVQTREKWEGFKSALDDLGCVDPMPHMVWSAKRIGVALTERESDLAVSPGAVVDAALEEQKPKLVKE